MAYTGEQKREYQRAWIRKRRDEWFEGKSCTNCGSLENLEVDHIDPADKLYQPRDLWSRRKEVRDAELEKCQPLCRECHIIKSAFEKLNLEHGASEYRRGCRCDVCKEAQRLRIADQRAMGIQT